MCVDDPFPVELGLITEHMTDDEIISFDDAIECYLNDAKNDAAQIVIDEINPFLWGHVWLHILRLEKYYAEEDGENAKQDH